MESEGNRHTLARVPLDENHEPVPLRKHFLQLDGLGVRELAIAGKDLLLLAGPTMDLDGPVFIFRWPCLSASEPIAGATMPKASRSPAPRIS